MSPRDALHPYVPPGADDSRAPCPGLNTLANHGYLPHDGRGITLTQLVSAIHAVYGISRPLATIFAVGGLLKCGHWRGLRRVLDLHDLARHGVLEHDGSLVHADTPPGDVYAPTDVDRAALRQLLACASSRGDGGSDAGLSLEDLCRGQVQRKRVERPLKGTMAFVARGELGLVYDVFGVVPSTGSGFGPSSRGSGVGLLEKGFSLDLVRAEGGVVEESVAGEGEGVGRVVPTASLEQWLGEERLPDGWEGPVGVTSVGGLFVLMQEIKKLEDQIRAVEVSAVADEKIAAR